jgi:hypothetical protein
MGSWLTERQSYLIQMTKPQAVETIQRHIQRLEGIEHGQGVILAFTAWKTSIFSALRNIFGDQSSSGSDFVSIQEQVEALETLIRYSVNARNFPPEYQDMVQELARCLRSLQTEVTTYWSDAPITSVTLNVPTSNKLQKSL